MHNFSWIGMVLHENVIIATNTQQLYQEKKWSGFSYCFVIALILIISFINHTNTLNYRRCNMVGIKTITLKFRNMLAISNRFQQEVTQIRTFTTLQSNVISCLSLIHSRHKLNKIPSACLIHLSI